MTTIVANLECMAADRRVTNPGAYYPADKIFRIGHSLFGTSGDGFMSLVMIEWLKTVQRNRAALYRNWNENTDKDAIWILELNPSGLYLWNGWGVPEKILLPRYAVGSGQLAALKGIDKGETPEEAVKGAMNYDESTGEEVQVEYLLPSELLPSRKRKRR